MIYKPISKSDFLAEFKAHGRHEQFSPDALRALHAYLEELSDDQDDNIELDVIALCCEYTEDTVANAANENGIYPQADDEDAEAFAERVTSELREKTPIVWTGDDAILYANY